MFNMLPEKPPCVSAGDFGMMRLALLLWASMLLVTAQGAETPRFVDVGGPLPASPVAAIDFLEDPGGELTPEAAARRDFEPLAQDTVDFGYTQSLFWLRFGIVNSAVTEREVILRTFDRFLRPLQVFERQSDGTFTELLYVDEHSPFEPRPMGMRHMGVALTLAPDSSRELYIRFGAGSSAALPMTLTTPEDVLQENWGAALRSAVFVAIIGTLVLVNLFYFVALRASAFLLYALMQTAAVLYCLNIEGFAFQYLWPNWPELNARASPVLGGASHLFAAWFSVSFLRSRYYAPRFYYVLVALLLFLGAYTLGATFLPTRTMNQVGLLMTFFVTLLIFPHATYVMVRGHVAARFYVAGWVFLFMFTGYFNAVGIGFIDPFMPPLLAMQTGMVIEAVVLSLGLADQYRRLNEDNRRQLNARLEEARERVLMEKEKDAALAEVFTQSRQLATTSHDIAQPIRSLRLALEAVRDDIRSPEVRESVTATLSDMEAIIGSALDNATGAMSEAGELVRTSPEDLLNSIAQRFQSEALEKGLFLRVSATNSPVELPQAAVTRCLSNLVSNAIHCSARGGILIGARRRGSGLLVQVFDTGSGMSETEVQDFQRLQSRGDSSPGHGLGLAIVREICEGLGWALSIRSRKGHGTSVSILLPDVMSHAA